MPLLVKALVCFLTTALSSANAATVTSMSITNHGVGSIMRSESASAPKDRKTDTTKKDQDAATCDLMLMTSFFTAKQDWQRLTYAPASFQTIEKLYNTVHKVGMNMTVIYDELPEDMVKNYGGDRWRWEKVSLADYDTKYGVNDVRFFFFERLLKHHKEWKYVFVLDAFDVLVTLNPCPSLQPGKLYIGSEPTKLKGNGFLDWRISTMGGKYRDWFQKKASATRNISNCGIIGGHRDNVLQLFHGMIGVMSDPNLACRKAGQQVNVNMAALNYVVDSNFSDILVTGAPVHSAFKEYEVERRDVWFIHKFF